MNIFQNVAIANDERPGRRSIKVSPISSVVPMQQAGGNSRQLELTNLCEPVSLANESNPHK